MRVSPTPRAEERADRTSQRRLVGVLLAAAALVAAALWAAGDADADPVHESQSGGPAGVRAEREVQPTRRRISVDPEGLSESEPVAIAASATPPLPADAALRLEDFPAELQKPLGEVLRACVHSCTQRGEPAPDLRTVRLTTTAAHELIAQEKALKARLLDSALATDRELQKRLDTDPAFGLRMPSGRDANFEAQLRERYPGWPDGYVFIEVSDGPNSRFGAVRLADDPVLAALARDHDALTGDYAQSVRAGYRSRLQH